MSVSFDELHLHHFDPYALSNVVDKTEVEHRLLASGTLKAEWQRLALDDLTLNAGNYSFPVFASGGIPHEQAYISLRGDITEEAPRLNTRSLLLDQLVLYAPGCEFHYAARSSAKWFNMNMPIERLQATAATLQCGELDWPRQGTRFIDLPTHVAERIRCEMRDLLKFGQKLVDSSVDGLTKSLASEGLIQLLVQAITGNNLDSSSNSILTIGRYRALTAMEACIKKWKADPVDALRVARIEGTSERMLELASREAYGVTPARWLKLARLNAAYQDLYNGKCTSVTKACQRWHFSHPGYFTRDYKKVFSETPRETLQRGRV
jgi:AraC-like DNA-binding protein